MQNSISQDKNDDLYYWPVFDNSTFEKSSFVILRRLSQGLRAQDWSVISLELIVLILGVFIGLQVDDWNAARKERAEERDYLVRLLDDSDKNLASISREEGRLEHLRVSILRSMEILEGSTLVDEDYESVQFALCRWYIDPALAIERGTDSELVSSILAKTTEAAIFADLFVNIRAEKRLF